MYHFIVIGNPVAHSKSPQIHQAFAKEFGLSISYRRQLCPVDMASFVAVVEAFFAGGGTGANVTLPFKEMAFEMCAKLGYLSEHAKTAKAVNTLCLKEGELYGDNTDGQGLVNDLSDKGVCLQGKTVAVLGAGGATRGVIAPLLQVGAKVSVFNRTAKKAIALAQEFSDDIIAGGLDELSGYYDVLINATSATATGQSLPIQQFECQVAYEMMYGKPSPFLDYARTQNARCFDGYGMLINQARLSFQLWTGNHPLSMPVVW